MRKIIIITPLLQHYRLSFYEKLAAFHENFHLLVFYGINEKEDGKAGYKGETVFSSQGFKEKKYRVLPFDIVYNPGMLKAIKENNPDVVILLASAGNITYHKIVNWAKREEKKVIIWTSGWDPGRAKGILLSLKNKLVSSLFLKADFFLTYSTVASNYVQSRGVDKSKIKICYNGIEIDEMIKNSSIITKKSKELIELYDLKNQITFLFVGGLIPEKNIDLLIHSFIELNKKYSDIKLLLIGDGPIRNEIEELLNKYRNPSILFLGRIIEDVNAYFAASNCLVLPGAGGLALNQAMFWKTPCIVSKADGTEEDLVIEDITGYRFEENNMKSLIATMERIINEKPENTNRLSENSHELILKKSNVNNMVRIFSESIENLLAKD